MENTTWYIVGTSIVMEYVMWNIVATSIAYEIQAHQCGQHFDGTNLSWKVRKTKSSIYPWPEGHHFTPVQKSHLI